MKFIVIRCYDTLEHWNIGHCFMIFFFALILLCCCSYPSLVCGQQCKSVALVHSISSRQHWEHSDITFLYGNTSEYRLIRRLGAGSFAEGYLAYNTLYNYTCAIKLYYQEKLPTRIKREILILQNVCGLKNIIQLYDLIVDNSPEQHPSLVFEYIDGSKFEDIVYGGLKHINDLRFYVREVLTGLYYLHQHGVIHRDIKPNNVMFDMKNRIVRIIDLSLARFHIPGVNHTLAGTLHYKAPEIILQQRDYDYKADVWSFGCIFAAIIFGQDPFFPSSSPEDQIRLFAKVFGKQVVQSYVDKVNMSPSFNLSALPDNQAIPWNSFFSEKNKHLQDEQALDLLAHLLRIDPEKRFSAHRALLHPFLREGKDLYRRP